MAFRSESEQLREQLRREEEKTQQLQEEKADLERQLTLRKRGAWIAVLSVMAAVVSGALGFSLASYDATRRALRVEVDHRQMIEKIEANAAIRDREASEAMQALMKCRENMATLSARECVAPIKGPCRCEKGDPLCSCL